MKSIIRTATVAILTIAAVAQVSKSSAQSELAGWNVYGITTNQNAGGTPPAPFAATTVAPNVIAGNLTKGTNPGPGVVTNGYSEYGGNTWTNAGLADTEANSIANGLFVAYTVQASPGYIISFTTNFLNYHNSATGPTNGALQYCTDGVNYSNIALISYANWDTAVTGTNIINLSTNAFLQNISSATTNFFRIVNCGSFSTGTAGTWFIYDTVPTNAGLQVVGNVTSAPVQLAGWNVNGVTTNAGGIPPAPFAATTVAPNVIAGNLTKGTNPGPGVVSTGTAEYGGNTWTNAGLADTEANSIANGLFIEYSVQSAPGYTISFTTNFLNYHNSATGPTNGALQYCTDGVNYSNIALISYANWDTAVTGTNIINLSTNAFLQNISSATTNFFRIVNWGSFGTGTAGTWYIYNTVPTNAGLQLIGTLASGGVAPTNLVVSPSSLTTNAGATVEFTVAAEGDTPARSWYFGTPGSSTLIANATNSTLVLPGVLGGNSGSYYVVLSNATGVATSSIVTLTVTGDPGILVTPNSTFGLLDGTAQFTVTAAGASPGYSWYLVSGGGAYTLINNGLQSTGSTVSGATSSTLTISNLQRGDSNNYAVVVCDTYGCVTNPPVAIISVSDSTATLAFWDFDGPNFTNAAFIPYPNTGLGTCLLNPPPYYGVGTASAVGSCYDPGTSPFSGSVDPEDGLPYTLNPPNFSWGTDNYPLSGGNKSNGVQFMTSTVGAKNIAVSYDSRVSATASDYERLQYTTNGTDWIDYPSSSSFNGVGTTYRTYSYSLAGFPGVADNPNFGIRVVTEYASTATYGVGVGGVITNAYVGTANTYGIAGTVTYDLVNITGQAITTAFSPPTISDITNNATMTPMSAELGETNADYIPATNSFTIGSDTTPVNLLSISAQSLNPNSVDPPISFTRNASNITMIIHPYSIGDSFDAAPILVTVTDTNGDSTVSWFTLTLQSLNLPPTNSLVSLGTTNMLANSTLAIPFKVGDDRTPVSGLVYSSNSANNTVMPLANIAITNQGATNPVVVFTPASNQLGIASVSVTVDDNDQIDRKYTTANIALMVVPNTNIVAIDYFNYDQSGALDSISAGYWKHLSGVIGQMQAGSGSVLVDTLDNTENLQAKLLGAPYMTNTPAVLYASYIVNMDPARMPLNNGSYFTVFNDGSGVTGYYECGLVATTNGAAQGFYRLGIVNLPAVPGDAVVTFPQDLAPNNSYVVVTALTLSNGFSSLWVSPASASDPRVTDYTVPSNIGTNLINISDFELRESGAIAGAVTVSNLKIGATFDSVFPSLNIQPSGNNLILTWSDPTLCVQSAPDLLSPWVDMTNATSPCTNSLGTNTQLYFKFGQ